MPVQAIDAWAQLSFRNGRQVLPEVVRLFEKSGTTEFLDRDLTADELIALMDAGHIEKAMLTARSICPPAAEEKFLRTNAEHVFKLG